MTERKQSWKTVAKKKFSRESVYRGGSGQYVLVTPCREVHYALYLTREEAITWNRFQCSRECYKRTHYIVDLSEVCASNK